MISRRYYHGTSTLRLKSIRENGFKIGEADNWSRWLCARGVYFVLSRPAVAHFFAKRAVLADRTKGLSSKPVVIEVAVNISEATRILDLTMEEGMKLFSSKYLMVKEKYGSWESFVKHNDPRIRSISSVEGFSDAELSDYVNSMMDGRRSYRRFNWDCAVLTQLVQDEGYAGVLAVFQEGNPLSFEHFNHIYEEPSAPHFHGIRYRDAINVCLTDLSLIENNFVEIAFEDEHEGYFSKVSSIENDRI